MKSKELRVKSTNPGFDVGAISIACPSKKLPKKMKLESEKLRVKSEKYKFKEFGITLISFAISRKCVRYEERA